MCLYAKFDLEKCKFKSGNEMLNIWVHRLMGMHNYIADSFDM